MVKPTATAWNSIGGAHMAVPVSEPFLISARTFHVASSPIQFNVNRNPSSGTIFVNNANNGVVNFIIDQSATFQKFDYEIVGRDGSPNVTFSTAVTGKNSTDLQVIANDGSVGIVVVRFICEYTI